MKSKNMLTIIMAVALVGLILTGCQPAPSTGTYDKKTLTYKTDITTQSFSSEQELKSFLEEYKGSEQSGGWFGELRMVEMGATMDDSVSIKSANVAPTAGGLDYSETNIQVAGVDEADIIKTDGNYIYTVSGNVMFIVKAYPGEDAEIVSTIKFDNRPESIFIQGDNLAVFGTAYKKTLSQTLKIAPWPKGGMTYFNIYDIKDRASPELEKEYKFEGDYFRGRMADGYVYLLTNTRPDYRSHPLPMIIEDGVERSIAASSIYYYPIEYNSPIFINIHAINLNKPDEEINSKSVVVEGGQNLYMSEDNIYVTYTQYINEYDIENDMLKQTLNPLLTADEKMLIEKIKATDNDILSKWEKDSKIMQVYYEHLEGRADQEEIMDDVELMVKKKMEEYEHLEFTVIHKIGVDGKMINPTANGKVPGSTINQFSLDENDGILRIATTLNPRWSRFTDNRKESTNNIYTLDSELKILDGLEGLAEDERIYSTRFIGDRLYMVTFKQVDPFFVIDLSDPKDIKNLGELKIPGFSRYLHPYDKDTIIGIGQDATETGRTKGLKISLFDVSDVSNPKEVAKYVTESRYAGSSALYEHKAFLFSKEKDLMVIPAYNYDYDDSTNSYNGAFVFEVKKDSIKLRGIIDHSTGERYWQPNVERSLYIEELLYTKSQGLLRINQIDDLSSVKKITLNYQESGEIPVF